jgi:uncharacterized YigZ family protein
MFKLAKESQFEITEKKSKFITRARIVSSENEALNIVKEIAKLEKGAGHNCFAYRILLPEKKTAERKNDDGEPGGTAGAPMLSVLTGENLVNILVITTRYFGGIKLGTGGLVNIYKKGAVEVIKLCGKEEFKFFIKHKIAFPINEVVHAEYLFRKQNIKILSKDFGEKVVFMVEIPEDLIMNLIEISEKINGKLMDLA